MRYERTFQIGRRELVRFHFGQVMREKLLGMIGLSVAALLIVYLYVTRLGLTATRGQLIAWMVLGFSMTLACLGGFFYLRIARHVDKSLRKLGVTAYEQAVAVDGFGVRVTANGREARLGFDKLYLIRETRRDFYIYVTAEQAWLLPKEQLEVPAAECALLRQIFETVVESRRLALTPGGKR